jgi:hypothetical protein
VKSIQISGRFNFLRNTKYRGDSKNKATPQIGGNGAYDTRQCHAQIAARGAIPSIPPREGAMP